MFFRTKSETARDRAQARAHKAGGAAFDTVAHTGESINSMIDALIYGVSEAVGPRAEAASTAAKERAHVVSALARERAAEARKGAVVARDRAVTGLDRGIDSVVPRAQEGIAGWGPRIDNARDTLVKDLLPRLQEMVGSVQTTKDDVLSRRSGKVAVITGAPKRNRKGGVLLTFGLLAAVGAAVSYYLSQKSGDDVTDPWAGTAERPIGGAPGVESQVRSGATPAAAVAGQDATVPDVTAQDVTTPDVTAPDEESQDGIRRVAPEDAGAQDVQLIDADDIPGTDPDARTGFGSEGDRRS